MSKVREIRFTVKSAQEAVEYVQRELGPTGRVVSVRQVTGTGLQRFLAAPKLEIIARSEPPEESLTSPSPSSADAPAAAPTAALQGRSDDEATPWEEDAAAQSPSSKLSCESLLEAAGFSASLMARLDADAQWREIAAMPIATGLPKAVAWLRQVRDRQPALPRPDRLAFLGGPGVGKTTSLCKFLAREVFIHGRQPHVLQLEVDRPHLDSGLSLYCDILGLSYTNQADEVDFSSPNPVFVDIPGFNLGADAELQRIVAKLDAIGIDERVMVLNAAYDGAVTSRFLADADQLGARYTIWSHLDELLDAGKLWQQVLDPQRRVLFFANGQNIAGDIIDDTFGYLINQTFPR